MEWDQTVHYYGNVLVLANTSEGLIFGGFRGIVCKKRVPGHAYPDPHAFIFSLSANQTYKSIDPIADAVWCDSSKSPSPTYLEGWMNALHFYADQGTCMGNYILDELPYLARTSSEYFVGWYSDGVMATFEVTRLEAYHVTFL